MWNNNGDSNATMQTEGGYTNLDYTSGGFNNSINGDSSRSSSSKRGQNCVPVMIAHLNRYGEDMAVWGMPVRLVTFVAILDNLEALTTKVSFQFRDETGSIKGIKWLTGDTTTYECPVRLNSYARVHGNMRKQGDETFVLVLDIKPLEHMNELLAHQMEVTLVTLEGEKMTSRVAQVDQAFVNDSRNASGSHPLDGFDDKEGLTREQLIVLSIIRDSDPENGAERHVIKSKVSPDVRPKVDGILEFLSGEGHIYTTLTDDHFKLL